MSDEYLLDASALVLALIGRWRSLRGHGGPMSTSTGLYVALAVQRGVPLITADARLSRAPNVTYKIEIV